MRILECYQTWASDDNRESIVFPFKTPEGRPAVTTGHYFGINTHVGTDELCIFTKMKP